MLKKIFGGTAHKSNDQQFPVGVTVPAQGSFECRDSSGQMKTYEIKQVHVMTPEQEADHKKNLDAFAAYSNERDVHLQNAEVARIRAEELDRQAAEHKAKGDQHSLKSAQHQQKAEEHFRKAEEGKIKLDQLQAQRKEIAAQKAVVLARIAAKKAAKAAAAEALEQK